MTPNNPGDAVSAHSVPKLEGGRPHDWSVRNIRRWKQQYRRFLKMLTMKQRREVIAALHSDGNDAALTLMFHEILLAVNLGFYRGMNRLVYVGSGTDVATIEVMKTTHPHVLAGFRGNYAGVRDPA